MSVGAAAEVRRDCEDFRLGHLFGLYHAKEEQIKVMSVMSIPRDVRGEFVVACGD